MSMLLAFRIVLFLVIVLVIEFDKSRTRTRTKDENQVPCSVPSGPPRAGGFTGLLPLVNDSLCGG